MSRKFEVVTLKVDQGTEILAEIVQLGGEENVSLSALSIDGVMDAIKGIASRLHGVFEAVKPQEASVEFGVKLAAKSGKLTGLLVEGTGDTNFKIMLKYKWKEVPA
ncbi:MAG: CU044_2847 family protein [Planctomycetota bacterium]